MNDTDIMTHFILILIFLISMTFVHAQDDSSKKESAQEEAVTEEVITEDVATKDAATKDTPTATDDELRIKIKSYLTPYKYDPSGQKRDPFDPPGQIGGVIVETPEDERLHPIERDDLDNIRLKAIISGPHENVIPRALFETSGKTYTLTKNDRIGKEGALIFRIESDRVWLMKPFADPGTGVVGYEPEEKILGYGSSQQQQNKGLFYER